MILSSAVLNESYSKRRKIAVIPLVLGVGISCAGEIGFSALGFVLTVAACLLAALKAVIPSKFLSGTVKLHPLDLLASM
jgi:hypothetical protein